MKKTKLLTSLIALALVASLGACEVNVGDVNIGGDSSDTTDTEPSEPSEPSSSDTGSTLSEPEEDTSSSSSTPEEPPVVTYTYSLEVENGESLTLNYDGALESQTGVVLTIWLVTTPSEGTETKEAATENDVTFTGYDQEVITISGLTVLPLKGGETSITVAWADKATATVGVTVNDITVYGPTSWADYITNAYDLSVIAGAFGDVSLDEILPFSYELLTNSSYGFQNYYVSAESFRLMYSWPSDSNGLTSAWDTLLTDFGYVKVSSETSGVYTTVTYTLEGGYKVEIKYSSVGDWDLYLYPPEPEPEPASTWNEYITNDYDRTQIANLFGSVEILDEILPFYIGDTDPTSITTGSSVNGTRLIITYNTEPTGLLNTWIGLLEADGWTQTGHESSYNEIYTFEKDGYKVELVSEFGSFYLYLYPKAEEPEPASTWNEYITNENYRAAVSELFGSVEALDEFLPFYSDTEPASIVTGTHYSKGARLVITYNSNILSAWVSLFEADGWTQTDHTVSYNETYTFEKDGYTVDLELEYGTTYVYVYPKAEEADEDLETAQAILNAVQGSTPNWTAFYGEAVDEWDVYTTEYLTTDEDGNLYGYKNEYDDWEETTETSYYYGGAKCVYNYSGVAQTPGEVYITYEEELEYFTYPLTISFNLSSDPYTLTALDDGYELTVAKSTTPVNTYTFTVDTSYNLLAIDRDTLISPADEIVSSHVEGITYADVEAFIATTNFNPADFGFGKTSAADQINAVVSKLSDVGSEFQYDDGFYYTNMELRPGDDLSAYYYDALTITATPDNRGYMAQTSMDILDLENTYYSYEYFSDGTDTYYYDAENGQSKEEEPYEFEAYLAMAEMYFDWMDFDQVCELIEASASVSDIEVDEDYEVSEDTIYIYANNEDWSLYYELDVEYDEDGLTYFSFSYQEDSYAYAVALTPAQYVDDPEWYVPTTGEQEDNPLAAVAGTYTGTTAGSNSMRLLLNEDGTGIYDYEGTSPRNITWTLEGNTVKFELDGDDVVLTWDAEAGTLIGTYYQDYGEYEIAVNLSKDADVEEDNPLATLAGSYTGTSNAGASLTLELYEDGTGLYDGNTTITWTFDGTNVYFEINYGDPVNLVWDAEAQTLTGTWLQDDEYDIHLSFTKVESGGDDTQEDVASLLGTWSGSGVGSYTYTVTIYEDGTYEIILPAGTQTGTWTGSPDGTIELDVNDLFFESFKLTYDASSDTAKIEFEDDDCYDYTYTYTRVG